MIINRRKFFFFGLAAGVGLLLPDKKIELSKNELDKYTAFMHPKQKEFYDSMVTPQWYGIPYHESNGSIGTWMGLSRT